MSASREDRYRVYSKHLREKFGEKTYKLPINLPGTCPNRDGKISTGGCIYCDEEGSGFEALSPTLSIKQQIEENKSYFRNRFGAVNFIAYFQAFTNTYIPVKEFRKNLEAACQSDIVGISISTRPDCLPEQHLQVLEKVRDEKGINIDVELGLQTVNYRTLKIINRGHTLAEFVDAVNRTKAKGFEVCVHMILNLPWDDKDDAVEGAKILSALKVQYVKLHSLYIVKGTKLGYMYQKGEIEVCSLSEYVKRVAAFLEYLDPEIVIQRLVGKGPKSKVLFDNWGLNKWEVQQEIEKYFKENNIYQGKKYKYLSEKDFG